MLGIVWFFLLVPGPAGGAILRGRDVNCPQGRLFFEYNLQFTQSMRWPSHSMVVGGDVANPAIVCLSWVCQIILTSIYASVYYIKKLRNI